MEGKKKNYYKVYGILCKYFMADEGDEYNFTHYLIVSEQKFMAWSEILQTQLFITFNEQIMV